MLHSDGKDQGQTKPPLRSKPPQRRLASAVYGRLLSSHVGSRNMIIYIGLRRNLYLVRSAAKKQPLPRITLPHLVSSHRTPPRLISFAFCLNSSQIYPTPLHPISSHTTYLVISATASPSYPLPSAIIPSHPILSHPIPSAIIPSHPLASCCPSRIISF